MKQITLAGFCLTCLFALGACTTPEKTEQVEVKPEVKAQTQENRKLERMERDFFDHGGSFK